MWRNSSSTDKSAQALYESWRKAEAHACEICDAVKEDYSHPRFIEASKKSHIMLLKLLKLSPSLHGALVKLKVACYYEDYLKDIADPECTVIAPRAVVSAIQDLESLISG